MGEKQPKKKPFEPSVERSNEAGYGFVYYYNPNSSTWFTFTSDGFVLITQKTPFGVQSARIPATAIAVIAQAAPHADSYFRLKQIIDKQLEEGFPFVPDVP